MNLAQFFKHWSIRENPFRGEEARNDAVFQRLAFATDPASAPPADATLGSVHSDFEKILGELTRPSTSVVFGEKGSGKTAIRLQIEERIAAHNHAHPDNMTFVVPHDDLNPAIAELHERFGSAKDPGAAFKKVRLVDHMDAILALATDRLVAGLFREGPDRPAVRVPEDFVRTLRKLPLPTRQDLLLLQALYDPADLRGDRTARMRALLKLPVDRRELVWSSLMFAGWIPFVATLVLSQITDNATLESVALIASAVLFLAYAAVLGKTLAFDRFRAGVLARRVRAEMRFLPRSAASLARSIARLEPGQRNEQTLPTHPSADEPRYHMLSTLRRVLTRFGYTGMLVLIDRVDEPTLVNGDADKMRDLTWPLFNNKFLQQEGFGVKMLLPIELRHALFKESSQFFQEARLDKQGLVERLAWTGPMLYDLCNARLQACRDASAPPLTLVGLFSEDVTRADVVDALDQMHQPRDAFKLIYRCMNEHCASVTAEEGSWRIPKLILDQVRRSEADRLQGFHRGIRPA